MLFENQPTRYGRGLRRSGHGPSRRSRAAVGPVARWDKELRELRGLVQAARDLCDREAQAAGQAEGPAKAKGEAALLMARAELLEREGELHLAVSDLHYDKFLLHRKRLPGPRGKALTGHCWEQSERAAGRAILAFQEAPILAAQGEVRQAVAAAMERAAELGASPSRKGRLAVLEACEAFLQPLERADDAWVPCAFLEAQEADIQRILDGLSGTG
jgi:hypothetical protein